MKFVGPILAGGLLALMGALPALAMEKQLVGWVERVRLHPGNVLLEAKLDTGAESSSLDATHITRFSRAGAEWVRFDVNDRHGKTVTLEHPLVRQATIKRHFAKSQFRPVIRLRVSLANVSQETEVNLVDRSGFAHPMLIGRKFMEGRLIIDPAVQHTLEPEGAEQPLE